MFAGFPPPTTTKDIVRKQPQNYGINRRPVNPSVSSTGLLVDSSAAGLRDYVKSQFEGKSRQPKKVISSEDLAKDSLLDKIYRQEGSKEGAFHTAIVVLYSGLICVAPAKLFFVLNK